MGVVINKPTNMKRKPTTSKRINYKIKYLSLVKKNKTLRVDQKWLLAQYEGLEAKQKSTEDEMYKAKLALLEKEAEEIKAITNRMNNQNKLDQFEQDADKSARKQEIDEIKKKCDKCPNKSKCPFELYSYVTKQGLCMTMSQIKEEGDTNKTIPFLNSDDIELSYEDLVAAAFDTKTPDDLCSHFVSVLESAKKSVIEWGLGWYRIIFLQNPETKHVRIWVD